MAKKQFKTESKKLLDMMINSIYTHKEIFLRELISNASDAIDKLYFRSLTDNSVGLSRDDFAVWISADKDNRILKITDNGIGMTKEELENNLGTIAKSGSFDFKNENTEKQDIDIIGQFGVGFYSAFMVSDDITVISRAFGSDEAYKWHSAGVDGYSVEVTEKDDFGTEITLHIKENTENEQYDEFLDAYRIRALVKKYSDYIRYPIKMNMENRVLKEGSENEYETIIEEQTLNSMVPLWRKNAKEVTDEEYNNFYKDKFYDFEAPLKVIHSRTEGTATYDALMFVPAHAPFDYYSKDYEKGLQLYSSGVLIMDKCGDLLPDYFSFVKGLVDSADLSLNISRELLQHDHQLKIIAKTIEKKIKTELTKMLDNNREDYEKFFKAFGVQLKFGLYSDYGTHKDVLKDLVIFASSFENKMTTLKEYVARAGEDAKSIYYACGETTDKILMLPQVEAAKERGLEVLLLTDDVDEFALKMLNEYEGKQFVNVCSDNADILSEDEKATVNKENEDAAELLTLMKESIGEGVHAVKFTNTLKNHPVCLSTEGGISTEMEKVLNSMPGAGENKVKAQTVLEISLEHPIAAKLKELYETDKEKVADYAKILYAQARLIGGMSVENPTELSCLVCSLMI